ncbi:HAD family hydrolase [Thiomicrorhabdus xiamenensis]|uniref:HAD family hydrolase n=1 Tax=Thiomicrorhabdus xiamenensis TaxID=2739063 RepID=A0A7D4NYT1_9GAMM|nr:HAD family hydrolase [Thiomicrorhabdus xiamenensis]QKI89338.1 HAD family hydrolase [Thiomicrorhabdus xiamenensis]
MLQIEIPGNQTFALAHLVLDYNGTLACDGAIKHGVIEKLHELSQHLQVHVITADTHGSVHQACAEAFITIHVIAKNDQDRQKQEYIRQLGAQNCVAAGNGLNDALMLQEAGLGIVLMQEEGCATKTLMASDLLFGSIDDLLDSLLQPKRLIASLRNG